MYMESAIGLDPSREETDILAICISDVLGLGVLALADLPRGTVLDHFSGEIGPEITQHSLQVAPGLHISKTRFIGYLSHGCDPNALLDMERSQLVALRDIAAGELLTIDYAATEDVLHVQFACHCGASNCRQWVTGRNDPISHDGMIHLDSLAPQARSA